MVFATDETRCSEQKSHPILESPHAPTGHKLQTDLLAEILLHTSTSIDGVFGDARWRT
jgi:hypothetical protein